MLLVVERGREHEVEAVFEKWDLHAVKVGEVTEGTRLKISRARHARRRRAEPRADRRSAGLPAADGSAAVAEERPGDLVRGSGARAVGAAGVRSVDRRADHRQQALGVSTVRSHRRHQHHRAAGHVGGGGSRQGHQPRRWRCRSTATAGSAISIPIRARCWPWPRRRATSRAPAASRSAPPTTSTSAIPSGRRSCGRSARPFAASATPAAR